MTDEVDISDQIMDDILGDERLPVEEREIEDETPIKEGKSEPAPAEPAPASTPTPTAPPTASGATTATEPTAATLSPAPANSIPAPRTWRPEASALWSSLPPAVQAEVQKREQDIFNGLNQYRQMAGIGQRAYDAVKDILPMLQQQGQDPYAFMKDMCEVHRLLSTGTPEQKAKAFSVIALHYGVATEENGATSPLPSQMEAMRQQIAQLTQYQQQMQVQQQNAQRGYFRKMVDEFAANKEKAPYFDEAVPVMTELVQKGLAKDLNEAYNKAIWLIPTIREKLQANTSQQKAEADNAKMAQAKQMASANVKGSQRAGSETTIGSMDETLWEALREIKSRG